MASASTALTIFDGAVQPIQNLNRVMILGIIDLTNVLDVSFNQMSNKLSNELYDVSNRFNSGSIIDLDKSEYTVIDEEPAKKSEETNKVSGAEQAAKKVSDFIKSINLKDEFKALQSIKSSTDDYVKTLSRIDSINDSLQTTQQLQDKVFASAKRSRGDYLEIANNIGKMGQAALSAFSSNDELIAFQELMQKSFKVDGVKPANQKAAMDQVTSIMSSGSMGKDQFSSLLDTAPQMIESLSAYTGKSKSELMQLASEGVITADTLKNSMFAASGEIESDFSQMPVTLGDYFNLLKNEAVQSLDPIITGVNNLLNSDAARLIEQYSTIIARLWAMVAPVVAQAAAWMIANWPITLVFIAIAALIGILMYFGVSAEQIVGFVVGIFFVMYARIYNIVALLYNLFASYAEFIINLFNDPVYAIQKAFYDLAMIFGGYMYNMLLSAEGFASGFVGVIVAGINGVLKGLNFVAEKMNSLFGTDFGTIDFISEDDFNINAMSDKLKSMMDQLEKPVSNKDVVSFDHMEYKNLNDSFKEGFTLGSDATSQGIDAIQNGLDKLLTTTDSGFKPDVNPFDQGSPNNTSNIPNVGKVDKVGAIEQTVDISNEDLKMMRELAEMKSIQNFVTLTPTVQVTTGPVTNNADINTIVSQIERVLEEEISSSAAGVYA